MSVSSVRECGMLFLNREIVHECLPMGQAVSTMKRAFAQLATGQAQVPTRTILPLAAGPGDFLVMPAVVDGGQSVGSKLLTLLPGNPAAGRPLIQALLILFDGRTGAPLAIMDGGELTAIRTGAASGAATDFLARQDATTVAILGAGRQARTQLEAVCAVRSIASAYVFDPVPEATALFAADMGAELGLDIACASSVRQAVSGADIICCATTSARPILRDEDVRPGTHVNAIGCYHPDRHEIPPETVARATIVVDQLAAARAEAGDLVLAVAAGLWRWQDVHAELGDIAAGHTPGRRYADEVTLFKSVGSAVQDVAAAVTALANARRLGLGTELV